MRLLTQLARPKLLRDVAGQPLAVNILKAIVRRPDDAPRVIILHGTYGIGKTSLARAFARALNCSYMNDGDACGICDFCLSNIEDTPYYEEYDSSIVGNVEDIKKLREFFNYNSDNGYRVITIDEAHLLTRQAQSALLKVFEEVSSRIFFVLCTTEKEKLLEPILSRSMEVQLNPIEDKDMKENLKEVARVNNIDIGDEFLDLIISRSEGHLRDAHICLQNYSLLDKEDFIKTVRTARKSYIGYFIYCLEGNIDKAKEFLGNLLNFPLATLKKDYEALILEIMEVAVKASEPKDKVIATLVSRLASKQLDFYYVVTDNVIINSFSSSDRFKAGMFVIYQKLNMKIR